MPNSNCGIQLGKYSSGRAKFREQEDISFATNLSYLNICEWSIVEELPYFLD